MLGDQPLSPLFPYTTLFRSLGLVGPTSRRHPQTPAHQRAGPSITPTCPGQPVTLMASVRVTTCTGPSSCRTATVARQSGRSEEHTSELQSQSNLVCRLLLEK